MAKNPYCKICNKYHYERSSYYDSDLSETVYFCSDNHKNEYLNKKRDPNYKTSQDRFMEELNERRENERAERRRKLKDIEDFYEKNPDGDYNNQSSNYGSSRSNREDVLAEIQEEKANAEREAKANAERKKRAAELRSQGKNFQAFLVEYQTIVIGLFVLVGFALFFFFFTKNEDNKKADAMIINSELELIEDSVKIYINEKNYDRALVLANKLVHSSHEDMEHLEFDVWDGYPKFDEYWTKKREEYKNIIINKGSLTEVESEIEQSPEKKDDSELRSNSMSEEARAIQNEIDSMSNFEEFDDQLDDEYKY